MKIKKLSVIAAMLAIAGSSLTAHSEEFYAGAQYSLIDFEASSGGISVDWEPTSLIFRGGVDLSDYFQLEGRLGFGLSDDDNAGVSVEVDRLIGLYGKASLPGELSPYIILNFYIRSVVSLRRDPFELLLWQSMARDSPFRRHQV